MTVACALPATALGVPGVPGATFAVGITALDAALDPDVPMPFVAVALKV